MADYPLKRRHLTFEANVHAPLDLAQAVLPSMLEAGEGWILNLSSGTAALARPTLRGRQSGHHDCDLWRVESGARSAHQWPRRGTVRQWRAGQRRTATRSRALRRCGQARRHEVAAEQVESIEQMVEGSVVLACCDEDITGRSTVSLDNLIEFNLPFGA